MTIVIALSACSDDGSSVTTPTSATTTTVAEASVSEEFVDRLPVDGSVLYSFSVAQYGTVNISLSGVEGAYVPSTVWLGLGIGQPSGTDCATTSTVNVAPSTGPHLTGVYSEGVYCAKAWDIGNLYAPAGFRTPMRAVVQHPARSRRAASTRAVSASVCSKVPLVSMT